MHLVVDGSNIATEGRTHPSIHQLREAVQALAAEHPGAKITVVVDATFGHRIDPVEVPEFDAAVANNELVAPPAGAIGRGDAFVLGIADKVNGSILSNDSYQEFHGQYAWLFDEGRLIGGKPVPHVGWVFVNRLPVRGPLSRKSVSEAKRKGGRSKGPTAPLAGDGSVRVGSAEASKPMPVPTAPPPGVVVARGGKKAAAAAKAPAAAPPKKAPKQGRVAPAPAEQRAASERATPNEPLNDQLAFLSFVAEHPVGAPVVAVVDHYSSHGAYVRIGEVRGYVPLRLMGTPPPTSARSAMKIGETVRLVVHQYVAAKRSIDLAVPDASAAPAATTPSGRKSSTSTAGLRKVAAAPSADAAGRSPAKAAGTKAAGTKSAGAKGAGTTTAAKKAAGAKAAGTKAAAKKAATVGRVEAAPKAAVTKAAGGTPARASKASKASKASSRAAATSTGTGTTTRTSTSTRKAAPAKAAAGKAAVATASPRTATTPTAAKASARAATASKATSPAAKSPAAKSSGAKSVSTAASTSAARPSAARTSASRRTKG